MVLHLGSPELDPDGREIWFTASHQGESSGIHAVDLSGRRRLVTRVPGELELDDISRDGRVLAAHHTLVRIMMARLPGEEKDRDLSWLDESVPTDLSRDGKTILFHEAGQGSGSAPGVYVRKTDGSAAVRLGDGWALSLSRDGTHVLAQEPAQRHLMVLPTGAGQARTLPGEYSEVDWAQWLPDGKRIVFSAAVRGGSRQTFVQDIEGSAPKPLGPAGLSLMPYTDPVSPDGRVVLAMLNRKVQLVPVEGGESVPARGLNPGDRPIRWTEDGRALYVTRRAESPASIWMVDPGSGERKLFRQVTPSEPTRGILQLLITPDGQTYVYSFRRALSDLYLIEGLK